MREFKGFYKTTDHRKYNTWCKYRTMLDTYGCGCEHNCKYCYAKALLDFRNNWHINDVAVASLQDIWNKIKMIPRNEVVRLGHTTDCFQSIENKYGITYETIKMLNRHKANYLIVTKSPLVATDKYINIYDRDLAHFQITITGTDDNKCLAYENAPVVSERISAIEKLYDSGFDVSIRLSPFLYNDIDFSILNSIDCDKILIEYLKVNHWIKKWFDIDYTPYTLKYGGYSNLELDEKIRQLEKITGFEQVSVGEYVAEHHEYFSGSVNYNSNDCCNLDIRHMQHDPEQMSMEIL